MFLTDQQIKSLVQSGKVKIEPYSESLVRAGRYDIHLGQFLLLPKPTTTVLDPGNPTVQPEYERINLKSNSFTLQPGQFVLGQTLEKLTLAPDVGMFLDGSSTLARLGVSIHQAANFIPPGQDAHVITLEIMNVGPWQIKLSYKLRMGKLMVFTYSKDNVVSTRDFNRYNHQSETTGALLKKGNQA